jgi:glycosyltransferase involved in cell wall biosynthesis
MNDLPFVSICTPTFNRRPFIPHLIRCFVNQTYPKNKLEWIIVDDGSDLIKDLVCHIPQVKYHSFKDTKMTLGKKRNLMHKLSTGSIIVYMDDDDYYPPERVSHAVETLQKNPQALCAGSSEMYIYFKHIKKLLQFGPYGPNHSTAATFAFRKKLLDYTSYDDEACLAEEKAFLKDYTIPFVQLDSLKTILVFSHIHNSFDKKSLLNNKDDPNINETNKTVDLFIKDEFSKKFYMEDIDDILKDYEPGRIENKPDVQKQILEITKKREDLIEKYQNAFRKNKENVSMEYKKIKKQLEDQSIIIQQLNNENNLLREKNEYLSNKIKELIQQRIDETKRNDKSK